jgi:phage-related minor tail protein
MAGKEFPLTLTIRALDKATAPLRDFQSKLKRISAPVRHMSQTIGRLGARLALLGAGGAVALGAVLKSTIAAGDELATMAGRAGLAVDAYASLRFAAAQADVEQSEFTTGMQQLTKRIGEMRAGTGPLLAFLNRVSPALAKQVKGAKSTEEVFGFLADAMTKLEDPAKRAALANAAFGRSGAGMADLLKQGRASIEKNQAEYTELSGSQKDFAEGAGALDNALRRAQVAFLGLRNAVAGALFPALTKLVGVLTGFFAKHRDSLAQWAHGAAKAIERWVARGGIEELVASFKDVAKTVVTIVDKLGGLKGALAVVAAVMVGPSVAAVGMFAIQLGMLAAKFAAVLLPALAVATKAMIAFGVAMFANPIGLVIAGVAALAAAAYLIYKNWEPIKAFFADLWDGIVAKAKAAWEYLKGMIAKMGGVIQILKNPIGAAKNALTSSDAPKSFGAASAAQLAKGKPVTNETHVVVDFNNAPRGTRVNTRKSNSPVDLNLGVSMADSP